MQGDGATPLEFFISPGPSDSHLALEFFYLDLQQNTIIARMLYIST